MDIATFDLFQLQSSDADIWPAMSDCRLCGKPLQEGQRVELIVTKRRDSEITLSLVHADCEAT